MREQIRVSSKKTNIDSFIVKTTIRTLAAFLVIYSLSMVSYSIKSEMLQYRREAGSTSDQTQLRIEQLITSLEAASQQIASMKVITSYLIDANENHTRLAKEFLENRQMLRFSAIHAIYDHDQDLMFSQNPQLLNQEFKESHKSIFTVQDQTFFALKSAITIAGHTEGYLISLIDFNQMASLILSPIAHDYDAKIVTDSDLVIPKKATFYDIIERTPLSAIPNTHLIIKIPDTLLKNTLVSTMTVTLIALSILLLGFYAFVKLFLAPALARPIVKMGLDIEKVDINNPKPIPNRYGIKDLWQLIESFNNLINKMVYFQLDLKRKDKSLRTLFHNIPIGVIGLGEGGRITGDLSKEAIGMLGFAGKIEEGFAFGIFLNQTSLRSEQVSTILSLMDSCVGNHQANFRLNSHFLPTHLSYKKPDGETCYLQLSWSLVSNDQLLVEKIILCLQDITHIKHLEKASREKEDEVKILKELISISQQEAEKFFESTAQHVDLIEDQNLKTPIKPYQQSIISTLHTIKGNSRTAGFQMLSNIVHETEVEILKLSSQATPWDIYELLRPVISEFDRIRTLAIKLHRIGPARDQNARTPTLSSATYKALLRFYQEIPGKAAESKASTQGFNHLEITQFLRDCVQDMTMSLEEILKPSINKTIEYIYQSHLWPPRITFHNDQRIFLRHAVDLLHDAFGHLIRNAIDHGINPRHQKSFDPLKEPGAIDITVLRNLEGSIEIHMKDDGLGANLDALKNNASKLGIAIPMDQSNNTAILEVMFASGATTLSEVTITSGHGIGMNAVRGMLTAAGGSIEVECQHKSDQTKQSGLVPIKFILKIPPTLFFLEGVERIKAA